MPFWGCRGTHRAIHLTLLHGAGGPGGIHMDGCLVDELVVLKPQRRATQYTAPAVP
jgi:hypothetical protein